MIGTVTVDGGRTVRGTLRVPGDKSISHRALLLAALAEGTSRVSGLSNGLDVGHTARIIQALGADVEPAGVGGLSITGGRSRLREPAEVLDVGNSGTGIRLLAGFVAGLDGLFVFQGDESIARRPMDRVADPLRQMGARIDGRDGGRYTPLVVRGGGLRGIRYVNPVASAQVKGSVLLAGLGAEGPTTVVDSVPTRAHTEEMLAAAGAKVEVSDDRLSTTVHPSTLQPFTLDVPGDPSQAAFWVVAACVAPDAEVTIDHVYLGPARAEFLDVLRRMGADLTVENGRITARSSRLVGTRVAGAEIPGLIDEIPILAVAAAAAEGPTTFADAAELRVKETDRVATTVALLEQFGARAEPRPDGLVVAGGTDFSALNEPGRPTERTIHSGGDHRIAMAAAVAGSLMPGRTRIVDFDCVATSYPTFAFDLAALGGGQLMPEETRAEEVS